MSLKNKTKAELIEMIVDLQAELYELENDAEAEFDIEGYENQINELEREEEALQETIDELNEKNEQLEQEIEEVKEAQINPNDLENIESSIEDVLYKIQILRENV